VEIARVPERGPGAAIGQEIGVHRRSSIERGAHALADIAIPRTLVLGDIDAGVLPQGKLGLVRAGTVATRDEWRLFGLDAFQGGKNVLRSLDAGRIALRADQDKVVVHDVEALHA